MTSENAICRECQRPYGKHYAGCSLEFLSEGQHFEYRVVWQEQFGLREREFDKPEEAETFLAKVNAGKLGLEGAIFEGRIERRPVGEWEAP